MFDHFLTTVLQIIIVIDVLGLIAYFVLGALRPETQKQNHSLPRSSSFWHRLPWRNSQAPVAATNSEFGKLKEILNSYRQGLAKV